MESFVRRLKYYGIGFGIGLVFVLFFFQNRGCSWLPANRVKNSILERVLVMPDIQKDYMLSQGIKKEDIISVLNDGDVNFDASLKKANPQVYLIEKEMDNGKNLKVYFTLPKESFISEVHLSESRSSKVKNSKLGFGKIMRLPIDKHMVYVDSSKVVTCQQEKLALLNTVDIYHLWKKDAKVDFSKSALSRSPKPEHYIIFKDKKGREIGSKSIWYKTKINISSFELPFETDCSN
jgi:hypothetical protein